MNRETAAKAGTFLALIGLCAVVRLIPHPPNFTPVAAAALFAGFFFKRSWTAFALPILAVLVSDVILGSYSWTVMTVVYAAHLFPVLLGMRLSKKLSALRVAGYASGAAVLFFLGTNLAVWYSGVLYERTAAGLVACYTAGLPFFQHTLLGNLFWSGIIFGAYAFATWTGDIYENRKLVPQPVRKR